MIIEDCLRQEGSSTAYYYCTSADWQRNTCIAILRGFVSQLVGADNDLLPYCHEKYLSSGEPLLTSLPTARQLLELFCGETRKLYLVVDGLDECPEAERRVLANYLTGLVERSDSSSPGSLRLLVVSQVEGDIKKLLSSATTFALCPEDNGGDIRSFVGRQMVEVRRQFGIDDTEVEHVTMRTCAVASGERKSQTPAALRGHIYMWCWRRQEARCSRAGSRLT